MNGFKAIKLITQNLLNFLYLFIRFVFAVVSFVSIFSCYTEDSTCVPCVRRLVVAAVFFKRTLPAGRLNFFFTIRINARRSLELKEMYNHGFMALLP